MKIINNPDVIVSVNNRTMVKVSLWTLLFHAAFKDSITSPGPIVLNDQTEMRLVIDGETYIVQRPPEYIDEEEECNNHF